MAGFFAEWLDGINHAAPFIVIGPLLLVPFIIAEQLRPAIRRPGWREYGMNILIATTTLVLAMPFGILAGSGSETLRNILPWEPLDFSYATLTTVPMVGGLLEVLAMTFLPILVHDLWFYWAHRIEHRVPFLWEFHTLHHSDELTNCSTWARDHFLQAAWIAVVPAFSIGLVFNISAIEAGQAAMLSMMFLSFLSMFYHSAIRVSLPWLDRIIVTPQVHRLHHSVHPEHYNSNFADAFPFMDMLFGTYKRPEAGEFPETGLGPNMPAPRNIWRAQVGPALAGVRRLFGKA